MYVCVGFCFGLWIKVGFINVSFGVVVRSVEWYDLV